MNRTIRLSRAALCAVTVAASQHCAQGAILLSSNFATYSNGNLVGQDGWNQLGAVATSPIQVSGGEVVIPGGQSADNQDAWKNLTSVISAPAVGTTSTFYGLKLTMDSASAVPPAASPSYFAAIYNLAGGSGFANVRLAAQDNSASVPGTFVLAARITGQSGNPFTLGTTPLTYGTPYNIVVQEDMVAGAGNDVLNVFVNPTNPNPALETPYLTNLIGGGTDPSGMGSFVLSQFASGTVANSGLTTDSIIVSDLFAEAAMIPEPSSIVLAGLSLIGLVGYGVRRRA